jgi:transposase
MNLTDEQWEHLGEQLPMPKRLGRPRRDEREVLNGILWVLKTGARWADLPERYPSYRTCHRRFQDWTTLGVIRKMLKQIAQDLHEQGDIDFSEYFMDGRFVAAKKGGSRWARPNAVKAPRL